MSDDEKVTASRPVDMVKVSVIGTGDGSRLASGTVAVTPGPHTPNVVTEVITPVVAIAIRFVKLYLVVLLGILGGAMSSNVIPAQDFAELFMKCAGLSVAAAVLDMLKNLITVFSGLEQKYPLLGNV